MQYKWLSGDQLTELWPIFIMQGWTIPPATSLTYAAYDDRGVAGFHVLQMVPHPEPIWIRPDKVGTGLSGELASEMAKFLEATHTERYVVIANTPEAEKLCVRLGMTKVTGVAYVK